MTNFGKRGAGRGLQGSGGRLAAPPQGHGQRFQAPGRVWEGWGEPAGAAWGGARCKAEEALRGPGGSGDSAVLGPREPRGLPSLQAHRVCASAVASSRYRPARAAGRERPPGPARLKSGGSRALVPVPAGAAGPWRRCVCPRPPAPRAAGKTRPAAPPRGSRSHP